MRKSRSLILFAIISTVVIFAPHAMTLLSVFLSFPSNGSINYNSSDEWVSVFDQNYPSGTDVTIYGLVPTIKSRYIVDVGWDSTGGYLGVGGVRFRLYSTYIRGFYRSGSTSITAFTWNIGSNRAIITIDTDSSLGIATVSVGSFSGELPYYEPSYLIDRSAKIFTPYTMGVSSAGGVTIIYRVTQKVRSPNLVTAIGSTKYQAYGYDGPRARSHVEAGMNEIRAAGMNGTIFADVDYILDPTYLQYLNGLVDDGWEVGIHFTEYSLDTMPWVNAQAVMTNEYNSITSSFNGRPPLFWCMLGKGRLGDATKEAWVHDNLNMILRGWRAVPQVLIGSHDIVDANIDYFMGAANSGVATLPIYMHSTEVSPAPDTGSLDAVLFDQWLTAIINNGVKLTGYQKWYMINSNQLDASFTYTSGAGYTNIYSNTNGYNAIILVKIQESTITSITNNGKMVDYWSSPEGYVIFEVSDNETYTISTGGTPPPSTSTHTVEIVGPSSYLTTYSDGTSVASNTVYEALQVNAIDSSKVNYGDTIQIKSGTYPLNYRLTGRSGIKIVGEGNPILDVSNLPDYSTVMSTTGTTTTVVSPANTLNKGQLWLTTATSLGAVEDDLVFIWSTNVWHNNHAGQKQGEIRRVVAINGNNITLEAPLEDTYLQSATSVSLIEPVKDINIEGIKFLNTINAWDTYPSVQQKRFVGLYFEYADNIRITNCTFDGIESKGIQFDSVINSRIDHNRFEKATLTGSGYGVDIAYASQNILIEYNEAYNTRHFVVAADTSTLAGIPRHITIQYNYAEDSKYWTGTSWGVQNIYDCHPVGEDINFLYNEATGTGYGLYYQGYSGNIIGNNFHDLTLYGIGVGLNEVAGVTQYQDEVIVQGNTITSTNAYGIWLGQLPPSVSRYATNIQILDNVITGAPTAGIIMFNSYNSVINNNTITGSSIGIRLDSSTANNQGTGNFCTVLDEGIDNNVM